MPERLHPADDQAAGLRRLFGARAAQVVAFIAGRETSGRTCLLSRTAEALARQGERVLLIDENHGPDSLLAGYGLKPRFDLLDLVQSERGVSQIKLRAGSQIDIVAAHRLARELRYVDHEAAQRLDAALRQMQAGIGHVLIDALRQRSGHLSPLALAARHLAVVVAADSEAITNAYALIKQLARDCRRNSFQVVVTRARNREEAAAIFENMRKVAQDKLDVRLRALGDASTPETEDLAASLLHRLPAMPEEFDGGGFAPFSRPAAPMPRAVQPALQTVV